MKTKKAKRQYLGSGFIWFGDEQWPKGYQTVRLTAQPDGRGASMKLRTGRLGGWQKVKLYAEYRSK